MGTRLRSSNRVAALALRRVVLNIFSVALAIFLSRLFGLSVGLMSLLARLRHTIALVRASAMSTTSVPTRTG